MTARVQRERRGRQLATLGVAMIAIGVLLSVITAAAAPAPCSTGDINVLEPDSEREYRIPGVRIVGYDADCEGLPVTVTMYGNETGLFDDVANVLAVSVSTIDPCTGEPTPDNVMFDGQVIVPFCMTAPGSAGAVTAFELLGVVAEVPDDQVLGVTVERGDEGVEVLGIQEEREQLPSAGTAARILLAFGVALMVFGEGLRRTARPRTGRA